MRQAWVVVALLVGCGDNAFEDVPHSGTRLRVEWYRGDDGSEVPTGNLFDRQRQENCYIEAWTDGAMRCTNTSGYIGYQDPACTRPLVVSGVAGEVVSDFNAAACAQQTAWVAGDLLATNTWYEASSTGCMGPYTADPTSSPLRVAEKQIDPNNFVVVKTGAPHGDGRVRTIDYASGDGLLLVQGYYDSDLATPCYPGSGQCYPNAEFEIDYLDAACTQPIVGVHHYSCGPDPTYAAVPDTACPNLEHYHRIGAAVGIGSVLYQLSGTTCMLITPATDVEYRTLGAEVEIAHLATAIESAAGRRLQQMFEAGEGVAAPSGQLYDTLIDTPCSWQTATDGKTRCLPASADWYTLFADAACSQSISVATWTPPACSPTPLPQFATRYVGGGEEVHLLGGLHASPLYYQAGSCQPATITNGVYYDIDPRVVDPASFEAAEKILDP